MHVKNPVKYILCCYAYCANNAMTSNIFSKNKSIAKKVKKAEGNIKCY